MTLIERVREIPNSRRHRYVLFIDGYFHGDLD